MSRVRFRHSWAALAALSLSLPIASLAQEEQRTFSLACAGGASLDLQSNSGVCRSTLISDGNIEITADEGAGETNFDDSEWQLNQNVRIAFDSTVIRADQARFVFFDHELVAGELSGSPVVLEDFIPDEDVEVRATAQRISYDSKQGTARMEGEVSFRQGAREVSSCDLIYDLNEKRVQSGSDCGLRIRIFPEEDSPASTSPDGS